MKGTERSYSLPLFHLQDSQAGKLIYNLLYSTYYVPSALLALRKYQVNVSSSLRWVPIFTEEEAEAQTGEESCPRPHSKWWSLSCLSDPRSRGPPLLIFHPLTIPCHHPPPHLSLRVHFRLPHPSLEGGGGGVLL